MKIYFDREPYLSENCDGISFRKTLDIKETNTLSLMLENIVKNELNNIKVDQNNWLILAMNGKNIALISAIINKDVVLFVSNQKLTDFFSDATDPTIFASYCAKNILNTYVNENDTKAEVKWDNAIMNIKIKQSPFYLILGLIIILVSIFALYLTITNFYDMTSLIMVVLFSTIFFIGLYITLFALFNALNVSENAWYFTNVMNRKTSFNRLDIKEILINNNKNEMILVNSNDKPIYTMNLFMSHIHEFLILCRLWNIEIKYFKN